MIGRFLDFQSIRNLFCSFVRAIWDPKNLVVQEKVRRLRIRPQIEKH